LARPTRHTTRRHRPRTLRRLRHHRRSVRPRTVPVHRNRTRSRLPTPHRPAAQQAHGDGARPRRTHRVTTALCQSHHCLPAEHGGPRETNGGGPLCDTCEQHVADDLARIAELWPDTEDALTGNTTGTSGEKVSTSRTTRLPLNEAVADARRETLTTLAYWAQEVGTVAGTLTPPPFTLERTPDIARWLARNHRWLTRHTH